MRKMVVRPDQTGYSVDYGPTSKTNKLDGPLGRHGGDLKGEPDRVNCTWVVDLAAFRYLRAFYRTETARGCKPFTIDLIVRGKALVEHKAWFVPGSMRSASDGASMRVTAQLDVVPLS